jgi:hypothetical protein
MSISEPVFKYAVVASSRHWTTRESPKTWRLEATTTNSNTIPVFEDRLSGRQSMDRVFRRSATGLSAVLLIFLLARDGVALGPLADRAKLRAAIEDLMQTFGHRFPDGAKYLDRLARIESEYRGRWPAARRELERLRQEALLANPLLKELPGLLLVKRRPKDLKADKVFSSLDKQIGYSAESSQARIPLLLQRRLNRCPGPNLFDSKGGRDLPSRPARRNSRWGICIAC